MKKTFPSPNCVILSIAYSFLKKKTIIVASWPITILLNCDFTTRILANVYDDVQRVDVYTFKATRKCRALNVAPAAVVWYETISTTAIRRNRRHPFVVHTPPPNAPTGDDCNTDCNLREPRVCACVRACVPCVTVLALGSQR